MNQSNKNNSGINSYLTAQKLFQRDRPNPQTKQKTPKFTY